MPKWTVCPFSLAVFFGSALSIALLQRRRQAAAMKEKVKDTTTTSLESCTVVFVLGGPGSGKGTQCGLLKQRLGGGCTWAHLSAGDLLREERKKGGALGDLINARVASGQLVPSEVTCKLVENAMRECHATHGISKFLVDGFPRSKGNADAWNETMSQHTIACILFFECPEEVLLGRLLERAHTSGRNDDTPTVIRQRFRTFQENEAPIVQLYQQKGMVRRIASDKPVEDVYTEVSAYFEHL
jgi:UMP-CMP kinase